MLPVAESIPWNNIKVKVISGYKKFGGRCNLFALSLSYLHLSDSIVLNWLLNRVTKTFNQTVTNFTLLAFTNPDKELKSNGHSADFSIDYSLILLHRENTGYSAGRIKVDAWCELWLYSSTEMRASCHVMQTWRPPGTQLINSSSVVTCVCEGKQTKRKTTSEQGPVWLDMD